MKQPGIGRSAQSLLARLAGRARPVANASEEPAGHATDPHRAVCNKDAQALVDADLAVRGRDGRLEITAPGRAHLARLELLRSGVPIDPFLGQHLELAQAEIDTAAGRAKVTIDAAESPLAWLVRRKGRGGRALIEPLQFQAGERLRADFTVAQLTPRVTANWTSAVAQDRRGAGNSQAGFTDTVLAARERLRNALDQVGPELAGLLLDVCCFLRGLEDIERERRWPPRSAKVVLQLGLDGLARHYGLAAAARGRARAQVRTWLAEDARFAVGE